MTKIDTDFVRQTWQYNQKFNAADTSNIADEIQKKLDKMYKEHNTMDNMTYCGKPVVDISPGVDRAYVKFMDNLLSIIGPRNLTITHESWDDGVTLELTCDEVHSQKLYNTNDVRVYDQRPLVVPKPDLEVVNKGCKTPKIKKDGKWYDLAPKKVIFSGPATTILWKDGTKTTVKCSDEDVWDDDVGIAMCYLKKMLGNKGNFNNIFREAAKVSDGCGWGFAKVNSSQVPESESYYSSALNSMKQNINEINEFMKDAADALDKALGGKK